MKTIRGYLDKLQSWLIGKIEAEGFKLPKPPEEGEQGEELKDIYPSVVICGLPHVNFSMTGFPEEYFQAPYAMISVSDCEFDYEDISIPILIQVCCYTVLPYMVNGVPDEQRIPDNLGTLDVLNFLEKIMAWLEEDIPVPISKPIRLGSYDNKEMTYPYAFGYISFDIETSAERRKKYDFN